MHRRAEGLVSGLGGQKLCLEHAVEPAWSHLYAPRAAGSSSIFFFKDTGESSKVLGLLVIALEV